MREDDFLNMSAIQKINEQMIAKIQSLNEEINISATLVNLLQSIESHPNNTKLWNNLKGLTIQQIQKLKNKITDSSDFVNIIINKAKEIEVTNNITPYYNDLQNNIVTIHNEISRAVNVHYNLKNEESILFNSQPEPNN